MELPEITRGTAEVAESVSETLGLQTDPDGSEESDRDGDASTKLIPIKPSNPLARAAPFDNELAPGTRARDSALP